MAEETVVVINDGWEVLRVFIVPTAQINPRDTQDIKLLAAKHNQAATFYSLQGFMGIEAVKWEIKKMNGET